MLNTVVLRYFGKISKASRLLLGKMSLHTMYTISFKRNRTIELGKRFMGNYISRM